MLIRLRNWKRILPLLVGGLLFTSLFFVGCSEVFDVCQIPSLEEDFSGEPVVFGPDVSVLISDGSYAAFAIQIEFLGDMTTLVLGGPVQSSDECKIEFAGVDGLPKDGKLMEIEVGDTAKGSITKESHTILALDVPNQDVETAGSFTLTGVSLTGRLECVEDPEAEDTTLVAELTAAAEVLLDIMKKTKSK